MEENILKISRFDYSVPTFVIILLIGMIVLFLPEFSSAQDEDEGIFWGEEDDEEYYEEDEEYYEEGDEYYDEGEEYYDEGEEYYEEGEEYYEEGEFLEEETFGETDEYLYGAEEEEPEQTGADLAEEAIREGFTVQVTAASPGYVNHTLTTWNSGIDLRVSIDFPFLMQLGPIKFRLGAEVSTFSFDNYLPIGGEFAGVGILGMVTFPAGPSSVQVGGGVMGSSPAFVVAQSFGLSVANVIDLRIGVRSTNAFNLPEDINASGSRASWMDGFVTVGYTL